MKNDVSQLTPPAPVPTEEVLPRPIGSWELLRLIGEGRLSRVYQARPTNGDSQGARYAVKVLREQWHGDAQVVNLLRREALVGRSVSSPHLVSVLASQVQEPPYYVAMPCLVGWTLAERFAAGRRISVPQALWIARQTAQALEALHSAGWLHGDIKPSNIFISPDGHVTLLDLGFAQPLENSSCALVGPLLGTLHYIAPEALISTTQTDQRSDIYSLGMTLYQMLSGHLAFNTEDPAELIEQHLRQPVREIRSQYPQLPIEITSLVYQMVAKNPLRRPQTAHELVRRLMALEISVLPQRIPA
ncbi:MAG TPA: serine/threonine-protein kinase [Pirellulales bacterium]|jgi:serine/threonine-protein kinase|nr:serine/threonine-protein kinase [Pirellulales bacterium]